MHSSNIIEIINVLFICVYFNKLRCVTMKIFNNNNNSEPKGKKLFHIYIVIAVLTVQMPITI
jgi:uncharacterized membrane protein YwzB